MNITDRMSDAGQPWRSKKPTGRKKNEEELNTALTLVIQEWMDSNKWPQPPLPRSMASMCSTAWKCPNQGQRCYSWAEPWLQHEATCESLLGRPSKLQLLWPPGGLSAVSKQPLESQDWLASFTTGAHEEGFVGCCHMGARSWPYFSAAGSTNDKKMIYCLETGSHFEISPKQNSDSKINEDQEGLLVPMDLKQKFH